MESETITCWHFYSGWEVYHGHLVRAIAPLTDQQLELRVAPHLSSIGLLAKHIVRGRAGWLYRVMGEGGPEVAALAGREDDGEVPPTAELVRHMESTFAAWKECLKRWTPKNLDDVLIDEYLGKSYEHSRGWIIWHVLEHDLHHGGELSYLLGAHGLAAPDL
jgi:uncharacterized damage-inducible protein DinB